VGSVTCWYDSEGLLHQEPCPICGDPCKGHPVPLPSEARGGYVGDSKADTAEIMRLQNELAEARARLAAIEKAAEAYLNAEDDEEIFATGDALRAALGRTK